MKKSLLTTFSALFLLTFTLPAVVEAKGHKVEWLEDYDQAISISKKENKPVALFFTGSDWCGACKKLKAEVFDKPEFGEAVGDRFIWVKVDKVMKGQSAKLTAQQERLAKQYDITGYPTVVVIDSKGKETHRVKGYSGNGITPYVKQLTQGRS